SSFEVWVKTCTPCHRHRETCRMPHHDASRAIAELNTRDAKPSATIGLNGDGVVAVLILLNVIEYVPVAVEHPDLFLQGHLLEQLLSFFLHLLTGKSTVVLFKH